MCGLGHAASAFDRVEVTSAPTVRFAQFSNGDVSTSNDVCFPKSGKILFFGPSGVVIGPGVPPMSVASLVMGGGSSIAKGVRSKRVALASSRGGVAFECATLGFVRSRQGRCTCGLRKTSPT